MKPTRAFTRCSAAIVLAVSSGTVALAQFDPESGDVLALMNELRMSGATCSGTGTSWGATDPLIPAENLFIAAHGWSQTMLQTGQFTHGDFASRIRGVCPNAGPISENIAGNPTASGAVQDWMASSHGHCEAIMNPNHRFVGVGMARGGSYGAYWTVKFASDC